MNIQNLIDPRPAIFLDRDGLIIKDCNYISEPKDVILEIGVKKFFREANSLKIPIIIVTNQSGISRGIFDWDSYGLITEKMMEYIGPNNSIIGIYANGLLVETTIPRILRVSDMEKVSLKKEKHFRKITKGNKLVL